MARSKSLYESCRGTGRLRAAPHDAFDAPARIEVALRHFPHGLGGYGVHPSIVLEQLAQRSEEIRIDEVTKHRSPALLPDRVHADRVLLRALELLRCHR